MKYHIITVIFSFLFYVFRFIIPVEVIFVLSGIYYVSTLFFLKNYKTNKWLVPPQLFTLTMVLYIFLPSILIYYGGMIYERFNLSLFTELNIVSANIVTLFATSTMWSSFLLASIKKNYQILEISTNDIRKKKINKRIFLFFLITIAIQFYGVVTNISGYSIESSSSSQIVSLFGNFSIFILVYYFYINYERIIDKVDVKFLMMLLSLIILGFAFASKSKVVSPFLYLILVDYFKRKKFNKKIIIIGFSIFILSFIIVPIIRESIIKQEDINLNTASSNKGNIITAFNSFLYRTSYVPQLIMAIDYSGDLPQSVEKLWEYHLLSPIYSVLPRPIYKNKPEITFGKWFSYNVYGSTRENNIGATYQGILYLNGGIGSVFIGFVLLGLFQAFFVKLFFNKKYIPIYLSLLLTLFLLPQEPWVFYVRLIQSAISLYVVFSLIKRF